MPFAPHRWRKSAILTESAPPHADPAIKLREYLVTRVHLKRGSLPEVPFFDTFVLLLEDWIELSSEGTLAILDFQFAGGAKLD